LNLRLESLPLELQKIIGTEPYIQDDMGLSSSSVYIFEHMVLKIDQINSESIREFEVLKFLEHRLPVPQIIYHHIDAEFSYLLMEKIQGQMLCDRDYISQPELLVECLADGLKALWQIPIGDCPFDASIAQKLKTAAYNVTAQLVEVEHWDLSFNDFKSPEDLLSYLKSNQPIEDQVFSHGDYCLPNIIYEGKQLKGMIDLGRAGVSSKWQDISLAVRSLEYNLGTDAYRALFFHKLGIEDNHHLIRYYMLVDELF